MYFNHAFRKVFPSIGEFTSAAGNTASQLTGSTAVLGVFGLYDAKTYANLAGVATTAPFIIASSSLTPATDKVGPFHGGYSESMKSKAINPKYINGFYYSAPKTANQAVVHIGQTEVTEAAPYSCACPNFLCGETYYLRIDIKGSPALRFLNHNAYQVLTYYTGCCDSTTPNEVDPTLVMIGWSKQLAGTQTSPYNDANPILSPFVFPVVNVYDPVAGTWSYLTKDGGNFSINGTVYVSTSWDSYTLPVGADPADVCAGIILVGAYVDTKFNDCSFEPTDYFEKEPIQVYASEVDETGDPCIFTGLCVKRGSDVNAADPSGSVALGPVLGKQGEGFGETVVRDLILSEMYRQNYWNDDPRIREITLGGAPLDVISRTGTYGRFYVLHSVPRFNNPTGTFDNDQYLLELVATVDTLSVGGVAAADLTFASAAASDFATDFGAILTAAGSPVSLEELG
jgi:hypothetical protein